MEKNSLVSLPPLEDIKDRLLSQTNQFYRTILQDSNTPQKNIPSQNDFITHIVKIELDKIQSEDPAAFKPVIDTTAQAIFQEISSEKYSTVIENINTHKEQFPLLAYFTLKAFSDDASKKSSNIHSTLSRKNPEKNTAQQEAKEAYQNYKGSYFTAGITWILLQGVLGGLDYVFNKGRIATCLLTNHMWQIFLGAESIASGMAAYTFFVSPKKEAYTTAFEKHKTALEEYIHFNTNFENINEQKKLIRNALKKFNTANSERVKTAVHIANLLTQKPESITLEGEEGADTSTIFSEQDKLDFVSLFLQPINIWTVDACYNSDEDKIPLYEDRFLYKSIKKETGTEKNYSQNNINKQDSNDQLLEEDQQWLDRLFDEAEEFPIDTTKKKTTPTISPVVPPAPSLKQIFADTYKDLVSSQYAEQLKGNRASLDFYIMLKSAFQESVRNISPNDVQQNLEFQNKLTETVSKNVSSDNNSFNFIHYLLKKPQYLSEKTKNELYEVFVPQMFKILASTPFFYYMITCNKNEYDAKNNNVIQPKKGLKGWILEDVKNKTFSAPCNKQFSIEGLPEEDIVSFSFVQLPDANQPSLVIIVKSPESQHSKTQTKPADKTTTCTILEQCKRRFLALPTTDKSIEYEILLAGKDSLSTRDYNAFIRDYEKKSNDCDVNVCEKLTRHLEYQKNFFKSLVQDNLYPFFTLDLNFLTRSCTSKNLIFYETKEIEGAEECIRLQSLENFHNEHIKRIAEKNTPKNNDSTMFPVLYLFMPSNPPSSEHIATTTNTQSKKKRQTNKKSKQAQSTMTMAIIYAIDQDSTNQNQCFKEDIASLIDSESTFKPLKPFYSKCIECITKKLKIKHQLKGFSMKIIPNISMSNEFSFLCRKPPYMSNVFYYTKNRNGTNPCYFDCMLEENFLETRGIMVKDTEKLRELSSAI